MKIDLRKRQQRFQNKQGLNDVYVFKNSPVKGKIQIGINGTSYHYVCDDKIEAQSKLNKLINITL